MQVSSAVQQVSCAKVVDGACLGKEGRQPQQKPCQTRLAYQNLCGVWATIHVVSKQPVQYLGTTMQYVPRCLTVLSNTKYVNSGNTKKYTPKYDRYYPVGARSGRRFGMMSSKGSATACKACNNITLSQCACFSCSMCGLTSAGALPTQQDC